MSNEDLGTLLLHTTYAMQNEAVDAYIAGLRALIERKNELLSLVKVRDIQNLIRPVMQAESRRAVIDDRMDHESFITAWNVGSIVVQVRRGDFEPGGLCELPPLEVPS